jgi:hypothetical protein
VIVRIDPALCPVGSKCPYFDPSYGVAYSNEADFEAQAVSGYAIPVADTPTSGRWEAKIKSGAPNIIFQ